MTMCDCPDFKGPVDTRHVCPVHGPLYADDGVTRESGGSDDLVGMVPARDGGGHGSDVGDRQEAIAAIEPYLDEVRRNANRMNLQSPSGVAQGLGALANAIAALAIVLSKEAELNG